MTMDLYCHVTEDTLHEPDGKVCIGWNLAQKCVVECFERKIQAESLENRRL